MTATMATDARRKLPSMDSLLRSQPARRASIRFGRAVVKHALEVTLGEVRDEASRAGRIPEESVILARAIGGAARNFYGLSEVINATGVLLHTGLAPRRPRPEAIPTWRSSGRPEGGADGRHGPRPCWRR